MAEILTMVAKMSRAGSKIWASFVRSIFHCTLEWLLFPGRSHCSRDASWLAVKFFSCMWDRGWSYVNTVFEIKRYIAISVWPIVAHLCTCICLQSKTAGNVHRSGQVRLQVRAGNTFQNMLAQICYLCLIKEKKQQPTNYLSISLQMWEAVKNRKKNISGSFQ